MALRAKPHPMLCGTPRIQGGAEVPERMEIVQPKPGPVAEKRAELEPGARPADQIVLIDADKLMKGSQGRQRAFGGLQRSESVGFRPT